MEASIPVLMFYFMKRVKLFIPLSKLWIKEQLKKKDQKLKLNQKKL